MELNKIRRMAGVSEVFAGDKASYTPKPQITEAEVSLTNSLNMVSGKANERFILVHDALSEESEAADMITVLDGPSFANAFIGAHSGTNDARVAAKERWTLYHFNHMNRAIADVNARLKKAGIDIVVTESMINEAYKITLDPNDKKQLIKALKQTADELEDDANKESDRGQKAMYMQDAASYDAIARACLAGDHKTARKEFRDMDTAARDEIFHQPFSKKIKRLVADYLDVELLREDCGMPHGENEEANPNMVACPFCHKQVGKTDFWDHTMDEHEAEYRQAQSGGAENEEMNYEDEEAMNYKSSLTKGQHVEYNGQPHIVVVPDAQSDFVGIAPVGQENDPEAVNLVHAREIMSGEEEITMDIRMENVRSPSDEEYALAVAALKKSNPKSKLGSIGVDNKTGDINMETEFGDEFILRKKTGKLIMVNEMENKDYGQDLTKLAKVINSVKTVEQLEGAEKYANLMFKKLKNEEGGSMRGMDRMFKLLTAMQKDLKNKRAEIKGKMTEAEDATVWTATDDKDESPESPTKDDSKITIPPKVKTALKKEIKELIVASKKTMVIDKARAEFYEDCADALQVIVDCLDGTIDGLKRAQIHMTKLMSPIVQRIPDVAYDFITRGGAPTTLKALFQKVKMEKK